MGSVRLDTPPAVQAVAGPARLAPLAGIASHELPSSRSLPVANLVPAVAEQREDDDQAVEELHVEAAQSRADDAGLDERDGERADRAAEYRADAAPGGVPPTKTDASTGSR